MPLDTSRTNLNRYFGPLFETYVRDNWPAAKLLIETWWADYKVWERDDTLSDAYRESRLTSRTWGQGKDLIKVETIMPPDSRTWDASETSNAVMVPDLRKQVDRFNYKRSVGMASLGERMTPKNFYAVGGEHKSSKYSMGLHDMSATLLNPKKPIADQAHSKANGTVFSFVPLSDPKDQVVFQTLNRTAKDLRLVIPEFYDLVRQYGSKMTRIKLAAEFDLATGFSAVQRADGSGFKIRYGLGNQVKVFDAEKSTDSKGVSKLVPWTQDIETARRQAALDFKSIVARILFDHSEIVVSFRQHAGGFPLFTKYNAAKKQFEPFKIALGRIAKSDLSPFTDPPT
jgi:hypothetical protein